MTKPLRPANKRDTATYADDEELLVVYRRPVFPYDAPTPKLWSGLRAPTIARRKPKSGARGPAYSWLPDVGDLREQLILTWAGVSRARWNRANSRVRAGLIQAAGLVLLSRRAIRQLVRSPGMSQAPLWLEVVDALSKTVDSLARNREKPLYALNRDTARERLTAERPVVLRELQKLKRRVQEVDGNDRATRLAGEWNELFFKIFGHRRYQLRRENVVALRQKTPVEIFVVLIKQGRFAQDTTLSDDDLVRTKIRTRRSRKTQ